MAAASIIARLLQAGTRQGQKAAAALLRMLKKSNPATLEKNVYKEYGNLGRKALSKDMLGPLSKFRPPRPSMTKERAMALDRVRKAASHGSPKGIKNTPGGMKATEREMFVPYVGFVKTGGMKVPQRAKTAREIAAKKFTKRSLNRRQDRYLPPSERERLRRMTPEDRDWERRMRDLYEG
tara:strand:- start:304 stop:843 length:540 start_codon:yes stop_codon:yes gene_type:complete